MEFSIKSFTDSSKDNLELLNNGNTEYFLTFSNGCLSIRRELLSTGKSICLNYYTNWQKGWHNIVAFENNTDINIEADVAYSNSISHIKILIIPTKPLYDKNIIVEFLNTIKKCKGLTEEQINTVKRIKEVREENRKIEISKLEFQKAEVDELAKLCEKVDIDTKLDEKFKKIFANYFKKYVKWDYLEPTYQNGTYNYLLRNNILFQNMKNGLKGLCQLEYPNSQSQYKLEQIDIMVDYVGKEIDSSSKNCAKIFTFINIFNVAIIYYSNCFNELYGKEFTDIKDTSIQDAILQYINLNNIDDSEWLRDIFVYFLLYKDKFKPSEVPKGYLYCKQIFLKIYNELLSEQNYNNFINNISSDVKINEKIYSIDDVDLMTGLEFESFVSELFKKTGYKTIITKASGDQGIDVIAEKNGRKYGIQAKCYSGVVSNSAIQEVVAGVSFYQCDKAIVITNNTFTKSAIALAQANNVVLWDRDMLKQKINDTKRIA